MRRCLHITVVLSVPVAVDTSWVTEPATGVSNSALYDLMSLKQTYIVLL